MTDYDYQAVSNAIQAHLASMMYLRNDQWRRFALSSYVVSYWLDKISRPEQLVLFHYAQDQLIRSPLFNFGDTLI